MNVMDSRLDWKRLIDKRIDWNAIPQLPSKVQIPRPPQCVAEFLRLADQPTTLLEHLASLIEKDSEIATNVLKIVNGSQLMLKEKISSISRAMCLLGVQRCKMLVMSAAIQSSLRTVGSAHQQTGDLILEAQVRALYAKRVAEILGVNSDIAYISALLQDLVLPQFMNLHPEFYQSTISSQEQLIVLERSRLNWDHASFTAALLFKWNFADEVVGCVAMHHEIEAILQDEQLLHSEAAAVAVSSLLPGVLNQEPRGIASLLKFQELMPEFDYLQVAMDVDEVLHHDTNTSKLRVSMAERLGRLSVAFMDENPHETNWIERSIGSYTLEEKIGQGGMGVVYRARHSMLRRPAAVKMLKPTALSAHLLSRFEVEAHITSELSSPHTVQVYDYGMTPEGDLYYVMEYLQGMSLAEIVESHGPIHEARMIHILCQVCGSLAEAHQKGLIHRDIKPDNIALTVCAGAYDFVKVLDFGLVAVKDEIPNLASANKLFGTPAYMAPEAIQSPDLVDERTDIYALGAVAYFCLTGEPLFNGRQLMEILQAQLHQTAILPSRCCSREFGEIVLKCLQKNPANRPASTIELVRALGRCPSSNLWNFERAQDWWKTVEMKQNARKLAVDQTTRLVDSARLQLTRSLDTCEF